MILCTVPGLYIKCKWLTVTTTAIAAATIINGAYHIMCDTDVLTGKLSIV